MKVFAPCKINLILRILGRRPDGFHTLETLMVPISVGDFLHFEKAAAGVTLTCSHKELPVDRNNLVYQAAELFFKTLGVAGGATIHLEKKVPVGAGLGGGSSDAAQTLKALRELYQVEVSDENLMELARTLGSDVAFFVPGQPAWCRGRGEIVEPLSWAEPLQGLLVHPGFGVSTPWAYQTYAAHPRAGEPGLALSVGKLQNDLEPPVFAKYLWLPTVKAWFQQQPEVRDALMSGSGSSVFALTRNGEDTEKLREKFRNYFGDKIWAEPFQIIS